MLSPENDSELYQAESTLESQPFTALIHRKHPWHPPTWRVLGGRATDKSARDIETAGGDYGPS
jgi:hypothetical protein